ncbi:MAG TPA: rhodanese-like domain-containing protein [Pseudonocardiaceae bacterium]
MTGPRQVPTVTVAELGDPLPERAVLLDVREADEWAAGHAPGALHIPMGEVPTRLRELPADSQLYVVCAVGGRSARVTAYLNANGWDALNVEGGMRSWEQHRRPLVAEGGAAPRVL